MRRTSTLAPQEGFTLIEMMIAVSIVGILSAVAIPGYVGFQEKSRRGTIERAAASAEAELRGWLSASVSIRGGGGLIEVDTNYDGVVDASDSANSDLKDNVAIAYANARSSETSPWDDTVNLWVAGVAGNGQIGLSQSGSIIIVTGKDYEGNPVFSKRIITDK